MKLHLLHRGDQMWVFLEHKARLSDDIANCRTNMIPFLCRRKRSACLSTRKLFCGTLEAVVALLGADEFLARDI
jgi:hypothetical protein